MDVNEVGKWTGVNQQIAKIAVWSVHNSKIEQGLLLCSRQHVNLTETELYNIATAFRVIWQIDVSREIRKDCFLCLDVLPPQEEHLCKCFREAQVTRYYDEISPQTIEYLRRQNPRGWQNTIIEVVQCQNVACGKLSKVTAGVVAAKFSKGQDYKAPKLCQPCFYTKQDEYKERQSANRAQGERAPRLRASVKDSSKVSVRSLQERVFEEGPSKQTTDSVVDLKDLQDRAASKPVAES